MQPLIRGTLSVRTVWEMLNGQQGEKEGGIKEKNEE